MKITNALGFIFNGVIGFTFSCAQARADIDSVGVPPYVCNWEDGSGYLAVTLNSSPAGVWILFSVDQTLGRVSATDCKNMSATLLAAIAAQRNVDIFFAGYTSCDAVPSIDKTLPNKIDYLTAQ